MKFRQWIETYQYLGQCDRLRMCGQENEGNWQAMMAQKKPISREEFLAMCDMSPILDPDETAEEFIDNLAAADPDGTGFFTSIWGNTPCCFLQSHGFEYIFGSPA